MDKRCFDAACDAVIRREKIRNGIGTLGEKTLHAVLKNYYEPHQENHEVRLGKYVADIVGENGIIEIQTRQFTRLLEKLEYFLEFTDVTVVYPIIQTKYLSWIDTETGEAVERRKSPKRGTIYDVIPELYAIKYTLDNPRMHLRLCLLEAEETRYLDGWSKNKKKGSTKCDRVPTSLIEEIALDRESDYKLFLPGELPDKFTSKDFAKAAHIRPEIARTALNLLTYLKLTEQTGTINRSKLYRIVC